MRFTLPAIGMLTLTVFVLGNGQIQEDGNECGGHNAGAADVKLATLLFKPEAMQCKLVPDYVGLSIPTDFIVGYGLDYDELGRMYRDIYKIVEPGK